MKHSLTKNDNLLQTFVMIDDLIALLQLKRKSNQVGRKPTLYLSELVLISLIMTEYRFSEYKTLHKLLSDKYSSEFNLPSYKNFVVLMNNSTFEINQIIQVLLKLNQNNSGVIKLIDSTPLPVCKNYNISKHKVCKQLAARSKSSTGWFYGFKLHILTDERANLLTIKFTTGNVDDREVLKLLLDHSDNSLFIADAGYCSKKLERVANNNSNVLLTCTRSNMKKLITKLHLKLLNLRVRVEVPFSVLKERLGLVSTISRSITGYFAHYIHIIFGYLFRQVIS
jgi:hypothetical protein